MKIIDKLIEIQDLEKSSDEAFAKRLGYTRVNWNYIKNGKVGLSSRFLQSVRQVYPGLKRDIDIFLDKEFTIVK